MSADPRDAKLIRQITSGLLWIAALAFALAWYLMIAKTLRSLPPTEPFAIGRITLEGGSKLRDYLGAAILYLFVPLATVAFHRLGCALVSKLIRPLSRSSGRERFAATVLFALPYCLAPFVYIATRREGWAILFPIFVSTLSTYLVVMWDRKAWLRGLFRRGLQPYHALVCAAAFAWILFRYTSTASRIARDNTLFLEILLILFAILIFLGGVILVARVAANLRGESVDATFPRVAWAMAPCLLLAPLGLTAIPARQTITVIAAITALVILIVISTRATISPAVTRRLVAWVIFPMLLFCLNYASTASSTHWTDLFHRGEALGPASDYLRGKVPYRDVFVLHGMFENGFLDAGLMNVFGRDAHVGAMRVIVFDCLGLAAIGILAMAVFNSIPLAVATVAIALVTSVGNQRAVLEILSVACLVLALRAGRKLPLFASGVFAALALFYSLETGIYSLGGALLTLVAIAVLRRTGATDSLISIRSSLASFCGGFALAAMPVILYLAANDALGAFFKTSFVTLPSMIDAVWSLQFPRIETTFATDRSLRAIADFVLGEKIRFALNPAILVVSLAYLVRQAVRRNINRSDQLLIALTFTAVLTQRSALGRADFPHQYFAAFLLGPIVMLLVIALWTNLRNGVTGHGSGWRAFAATLVTILGGVAFVGLWVPDLVNARIDGATAFRSRMSGGGDPGAVVVQQRVEAIRNEVQKILRPNEPLFDFSNQPALYFFTDRPNPTRFYQIPIISSPQFQQEVISRLESSKPEIVLKGSPAGFDVFDGIPNELRAPAVAAYIDDRYRYSTSVQGVELWRRIDSPRPFVLGDYLAKHRMPSAQEVADAKTRHLIFPSVGSGAGADASYWRSDLFLHNPAERAIEVRLRYRSSSNGDRRVTLPPRGIVEFRDVVNTLFGAPETFGSLIVQTPESVPIIARVMSYDSSRTGAGVPEQPLTIDQAASADGPMRHLVIPGHPVTHLRRFNIDAVNLGHGPAEIEIAAFANEGLQTGETLTAGIAEQSSLRLSDAEARIGVPLNENVVVRITLRKGTVVAYASIVDAATGESQVVAAVAVP